MEVISSLQLKQWCGLLDGMCLSLFFILPPVVWSHACPGGMLWKVKSSQKVLSQHSLGRKLFFHFFRE